MAAGASGSAHESLWPKAAGAILAGDGEHGGRLAGSLGLSPRGAAGAGSTAQARRRERRRTSVQLAEEFVEQWRTGDVTRPGEEAYSVKKPSMFEMLTTTLGITSSSRKESSSRRALCKPGSNVREALAKPPAGRTAGDIDVLTAALQDLRVGQLKSLAGLEHRVARVVQLEQCKEGATVCMEGDSADKFYIVVKGGLRVTKRAAGNKQELLVKLGAGDTFGEIGLLVDSKRSATVTAGTACVFLTLTKEHFSEVLASPGYQDLDAKCAALRKVVPAFSGGEVPEERLRKLAPFFNKVNFEAGHTWEDLAESPEVFFVLKGEAALMHSALPGRGGAGGEGEAAAAPPGRANAAPGPPPPKKKHRRGSTRELGRLGPGCCFGDVALFPELGAAEWFVQACGPLELYSVNRLHFAENAGEEVLSKLRDALAFRVSYYEDRQSGWVNNLRELSQRRIDLQGVLADRYGDYYLEEGEGGSPASPRGARNGGSPKPSTPVRSPSSRHEVGVGRSPNSFSGQGSPSLSPAARAPSVGHAKKGW